jgi:hypothetical protein
MVLGVGIPEILLIDPLQGLTETALDYMELKKAGLDFYAITSAGGNREAVLASLSKYGKSDPIWLYRSRGETIASLLPLPIQGVILTKTRDSAP